MNTPKISVVIPSYNKVKYISETLDSIIDQEYPDVEVIIQDGGSNDGTLKAIRKYVEKYPRIFQCESKKDNGQLDAINKGLKKATGKIVTFINADDVYEKGAFDAVSKAFLKNPGAWWFAGNGKVINGEGREIARLATWYKGIFLSINYYSLLLVLNYLMQPSVFLNEKIIRKYGYFTGNKDFVTEYEMWLKVGEDSMPVLVNRCLSSFRLAGDNISSTQYISLLDADLSILKRYTTNPFFIFLHKFHNYCRIVIASVLNTR